MPHDLSSFSSVSVLRILYIFGTYKACARSRTIQAMKPSLHYKHHQLEVSPAKDVQRMRMAGVACSPSIPSHAPCSLTLPVVESLLQFFVGLGCHMGRYSEAT